MRKIIYKFILAICFVSVLFSQNMIYASMADYTDEQADNNLKQEQEEFRQEQEERINKSSNNYLKKILIKGYKIDPDFDKQTINYEITQEVGDDYIEIEAEADDEKANVSGDGKVILNSGENNIKIDVTAENGMVRSYFIKIKRSVKEDIRLNSLKVKTSENDNIEITPVFDSNVFEYSCNIENYIQKLNIEATSNLENAKIITTGNENLHDGLNEILITVSLNDGEKSVYKLKAYKEQSEESQVENKENNNSTLIIIIIAFSLIVIIYLARKFKNKK